MGGKKGFSLVELLIAVIILAALAAIAIPRITQSSTNAKQNACDTNVDIVNSSIEMFFVDTGAYPAALTDVTGVDTYFPDGEPNCPLAGTYTLGGNSRITCDH